MVPYCFDIFMLSKFETDKDLELMSLDWTVLFIYLLYTHLNPFYLMHPLRVYIIRDEDIW